jgi:predicted dehydrogenase
MAAKGKPKTCAVWANVNQQQLLRNTFNGTSLTCTSIGCADTTARTSLASALEAQPCDDLRQMLHSNEVDVIWLSAPNVLTAELRSVITNTQTSVATSAPCSEGFNPELYADSQTHFIPLLRGGESFHNAAGCLDVLGPVQCMHYVATAGDHQTSLRALLFDAADLILHLIGMPDEVFAGHAGSTLTADPAAELAGHLTATMRFANGCTASMTVSDGGGTWVRRATLLGDGGRMIWTDDDVRWTSADGSVHEEELNPSDAGETAGSLSRWHLLRIIEGKLPPQPNASAALLCEAIRLSCVTGQIEEPNHVASMFGS